MLAGKSPSCHVSKQRYRSHGLADDGSGPAFQCVTKRLLAGNVSQAAFALFDEGDGRTELRQHIVDAKMSLLHILLCLGDGDLTKLFFFVCTTVNEDFLHTCQDNQCVGIQLLCKFPCRQVFLNDSAGAFETVILLKDRNPPPPQAMTT